MNTTRLARNASAAVVATIAAFSSYEHMVSITLAAGESTAVAHVMPLSVDGMLLVASIAMVDDKRSGRTVRLSAKIAFIIGVLASVGANVAAAEPHIGARIVAAWPAVALLLVVEMLSRAGKPAAATADVAAPVAVPAVPAAVVPAAVPVPATTRAPRKRASAPSKAPAAVPAARAPRPARTRKPTTTGTGWPTPAYAAA